MGLIYTGGTFDLFHSNHVHFLARCAELGDVVVVLNTDEFVARYKGKPPIMDYTERKVVLEACKYVRRVVENTGGADSKPMIEKLHPDIIAIGSDWARKDYYKQMGFDQEWLDGMDISLLYIPYGEGASSTEIKRRVKVD